MRARDYAYQYLQDPTDECLVKIATDMLLEIPTIVRQRKAVLNESLISVVKEQDKKWRCFVKKVAKNGHSEIREDGFARLIEKEYPDLFAVVWKDLSILKDA